MGIQKGDSPMDAAHLILVIFEGKILFSELIFIFIKNCWFYGKLKQWKQCQTLFWGGAPKSLQMVTAAMKLKDAYSFQGKL